ncbi:hypothetical protein Q5752_003887 [Cryptotrichosporon argae]
MLALLAPLLLSASVLAGPTRTVEKRATQDRYVFAHFMVGFVDEYGEADWTTDISLAHSYGLDGFALNCDDDDSTATQLGYAYAAAEAYNAGLNSSQTPFVLFVSPDFTHYSASDPASVGALLAPVLSSSAQLTVDGKAFVSSFEGDGLDWAAVATATGQEIYAVPYYQDYAAYVDDDGISGLFSWAAWPGQDTGTEVDANITTSADEEYLSLLQAANKTYMAPVSPWFYTHLADSTGYGKNYVLYTDLNWPLRWQQAITLAASYPDQLRFIEIITWNDWTESSLVGPYMGGEMSDDVYLWAENMTHTPMLDMVGPYISAFKAGTDTLSIDDDVLVYWYRPTFKAAECNATDNVGAPPSGWDMPADDVFVHVLLTDAATLTVTSGDSAYTQTLRAGAQTLAFPMGAGRQTFALELVDGRSASATGAIDITTDCRLGEYNFNILSGSIVLAANTTSTTAVQSNTTDGVTTTSPLSATTASASASSVLSSDLTTATTALGEVDAAARCTWDGHVHGDRGLGNCVGLGSSVDHVNSIDRDLGELIVPCP